MQTLVEFLSHQPLLVLFLVIGIGYLVGNIKLFGFSLGPAAVLFSGIAVGALDARLRIPEFIYVLGLILFVYTVGLQSGPTFFSSFGRRGIRANLLTVGVLFLAAVLCAIAATVWDVEPALIVGVFAGSVTNTPALASSIEAIRSLATGSDQVSELLSAPVIGYSVAYPFGVIGVLLGFNLFQRIVSRKGSAMSVAAEEQTGHVIARTYCVTRPAAIGVQVRDILSENTKRLIVFGRMRRGDSMSLVYGDTTFQHHDLVTAVCEEKTHAYVLDLLGEQSDEKLQTERGELDYRRIAVSEKDVIGRKIRELKLQKNFSATITRVRRGDVDFIPSGDTVIEHGDRVRVVTRAENMERVTKFFGDSVRSGSEADFFSVSIGIVLGVLLGMLPLPLPGGASFALGFAGGPLIVGLVLGRIQRTGSIIWGMPFSANLTLRQVGLVLFLAGIGTKAGDGFVQTLMQGGWKLALIGGGVTSVTTLVVLLYGSRVLKLPTPAVMGMMSGIQTQPACLAYANQTTFTNSPNVWYATVYPVSMVTKIILAQLLVRFLL